MYSTSVTGVVRTLSRLRLHVSSMKPVATAIWLWKSTWNIMIPARRYGVLGPDAAGLAGDVRAEAAPQDDVHQRPEGDVEPAVRGARARRRGGA